ncbi:MAG: hypothetical protein QXR18_08875 [Pyrobaculum sp.]
MRMSALREVAELVFTVKTPLAVLSGERAVQNVDFVVKGGEIYFIDWEKVRLEDVVASDREVDFNKIVEAVRQRPQSFKWTKRCEGAVEGEEIHVGGPPPASSIKGLLRTAYLYYRLKNDPKLLENFVKELNLNPNVRPKDVARKAESHVFEQCIDNVLCFDVFSLVAVWQRGVEGEIPCVVYEVRVGDKSVFIKAVPPEVRLIYKVAVREHGRIGGRAGVSISLGELKKALEEFSLDLVEFEKSRGVEVPCEKGVRLGWGAGRRWKTVLNLLCANERFGDVLLKIQNLMRIQLGRPWGDATVKYVVYGGREVPIGWACYEWR